MEDGREELGRSCEFESIPVTALKDIIAAGKEPMAYNSGRREASGGAMSSIIAPAVLFEEIELDEIEQEHDAPPMLVAPASRDGSETARYRSRETSRTQKPTKRQALPDRLAQYD